MLASVLPHSKSKPDIKPCKASDNWTAITFKPDLAKFDMQVRWGGGCWRVALAWVLV